MKWKLIRWSVVPALAIALLAACSDSGLLSDQLLAPDSPALAKGGQADKKDQARGPKVRVKVRGKKAATTPDLNVVLAVGSLPAGYESQVQKTFSPGSPLDLAIPEIGYRLAVPGDAVREPAVFKMKVLKRTAHDAAGVAYDLLAVELKATSLDGLRDLGASFRSDVHLYMPTSWVVNASGSSNLQIIWAETHQIYSTVECLAPFPSGQQVSAANACVANESGLLHAKLRHFSAYVIGIDE